MSDLDPAQAFLHAMNLQKLTQPGDGSDDMAMLADDGNLPTRIANGRLDQLNRQANNDFFDDMAQQASASKLEARRALRGARAVASDRLALIRTMDFIREKLTAGQSVESVFQQAQTFRERMFIEVINDTDMQARLGKGVLNVGTTPGIMDNALHATQKHLNHDAKARIDRTGFAARQASRSTHKFRP